MLGGVQSISPDPLVVNPNSGEKYFPGILIFSRLGLRPVPDYGLI